MAGMQQVSFTTPGYDYAADEAEIKRRQMMAELLQKQSMEPIDPARQVGGWAIPVSPWEGLAKIGQGAASGINAARAERMQRELAKRIQGEGASAITDAMGMLRDQPAQTLQPSAMGGDQASETGIANIPARPADPMGALVAASRNPMAAQLVGPMAMQQVQLQQRQKMLAEILRGGGQPGATPGNAAGAQPAQQGNGFGAGIPPQIMALMTSGDQELASLGKSLLEANKGIAQRPGAPVVNPFTGAVIAQPTPTVPPGVALQVGPGGPAAYPVPGAIPAMSATSQSQASATEAGKAPYQLETLNTPGAPSLMTREQAIEAATGRPMPQPGRQPVAPIRTTAPSEAAAMQQFKGGGGVPRTVEIQPPARGPGLRLQDQGESAFQREYGGELAKSAGKIVEGGDMGRRLNDLASAMTAARQQLQEAGGDVGRLAGVQQSVTQMAQAFGVDPEKLGLPKDAGPLQLMDSITNRMAMGMIGPGGMPANNFSEADREFLINTMAKKTDTPQGFDQKLNLLKKVAARNIEAEQSWLAAEQEGKSHSAWRREWNTHVRENPLYSKEPPQQTAPRSGNLSAKEQAELRALRQRFGR